MGTEGELTSCSSSGSQLSRYTFLESLASQNQVLFYHLALMHLHEILPIIYTPTIGTAIEQYSEMWRRPQGLFLTDPDQANMRNLMLSAKAPKDVRFAPRLSVKRSRLKVSLLCRSTSLLSRIRRAFSGLEIRESEVSSSRSVRATS